ncbi:dynein axonemal assembly factor 5 [Cloeon dipterum]|uniref:dynein axonemal assembly factor 5 n=1 Tax=Cloeon dipterum TaxID=197152 RepID=UPI00321F6593
MSEHPDPADLPREVLMNFRRGLADENKFNRKATIGKIRSYLNDLEEDAKAKEFDIVLNDLLKVFSDTSEACREAAVKLVIDFLPMSSSAEQHLTFILAVIEQRISNTDKQEPSEEVRLLLIKLLVVAITKVFGCDLVPHLNSLCNILSASLLDNFADVKLASCESVKIVAQASPKTFHVQSESFLKSLKQGTAHKHSKVRVAFISAIGVVVKYGSHNLVEKVAHILGERLYDSSPAVRKEVVSVGGDWLINLPDRYSHFCRIIPLVVTGMDDEMPEVQDLACEVWNKAGKKYEEENEESLKIELDYGLIHLPDYPLEENRPGVGCRALMQRETSKMLPAILHELHDWNAGVRMQSASLLFQVVRHLEKNFIQYLQKIWPDVCIKCADSSEPHLKNKVEQCLLLLGYFSPIHALLDVALPQEELTLCQLCCFAATLKGLTTLEEPHLLTTCQSLSKTANTNMELQYQTALLHCAKGVLDAALRSGKMSSKESHLALFSVALNLAGNSQSSELSNNSQELLDGIAVLSGVKLTVLYELFGDEILKNLQSTVSVWTEYCAFKNIFLAFVQGADSGIGPNLPTVAEILVAWSKVASTGSDLADMVRIMMPILSWKFIESCDCDAKSFLKSILNNLIRPNLKWAAGRVAEVRRSQALVLLIIAISEPEVPDDVIAEMVVEFPPLLAIMMEETATDPRLGAGRALEILCCRWKNLGILDIETTFRIVKVASERLDDVKAGVRLQALEVIKAALPAQVPSDHVSQVELLFKTAIIHLDDQDSNYSLAVLETLKVIGQIDIPLMTKLLNIYKRRFTNQRQCDELLHHFQYKVNN